MGVHKIPDRISDGVTIDRKMPFSEKAVLEGKLFRRKHGFKFSNDIPVGQVGSFDLVVPYDKVKINELEITNAVDGDELDLIVLDTPQGHIQQSMGVPPANVVPNAPLNQFGFGVQLSEGLYRDKSDYDADLIKDMVVRLVYKNNGQVVTKPRGNITWHEVK